VGSAVAVERSGAALDLGTPPHIVQEIVGHSAIEATMTIYAHVSLEDKRQALARLGETLG
jgi:integrase